MAERRVEMRIGYMFIAGLMDVCGEHVGQARHLTNIGRSSLRLSNPKCFQIYVPAYAKTEGD